MFKKAKENFEKEDKKRDDLIIATAVNHPDWNLQEISDYVETICGECNPMKVSRVLRRSKGIRRN